MVLGDLILDPFWGLGSPCRASARLGLYWGGLYGDNGQENGNYCNGLYRI